MLSKRGRSRGARVQMTSSANVPPPFIAESLRHTALSHLKTYRRLFTDNSSGLGGTEHFSAESESEIDSDDGELFHSIPKSQCSLLARNYLAWISTEYQNEMESHSGATATRPQPAH
jgi:hypothetical protein